MKYIDGRLPSYVTQLERYVDNQQLPYGWFEQPDHVGINVANYDDFDKTLDSYRECAQHISWVEKEGRRLASVWLSGKLAVGGFGDVEWVEVSEPPLELSAQYMIGLERVDFYCPDMAQVRALYAKRKNDVQMHIGPRYSRLNFRINAAGQEVGLVNSPLSDVVGRELRSGEARIMRYE